MGKPQEIDTAGSGPLTPEGMDSRNQISLSQLDRRRAQLWAISIFVLVALTVIVAVLTLGRDLMPSSLRPRQLSSWIAIVLAVGLGLAFLLYVMQREREMRGLSALLVRERERAAELGSRLEEERKIVARLKELDRLRSDFVATVSHELKTPLTGIIGASRTVAHKGNRMSAEQLARFIDLIERQSTRLVGLVEEALLTSRIESGAGGLRRERVDLGGIIETVVEDIRHTEVGRDRRVVVHNGSHARHVWGDPAALHQVIANLVENGLKYSDTGSEVSVRLEDGPSEVLIEVADKGQGIAPDEMKTIFDRFRQVDSAQARGAGGFGLGLYIVKNLVEQHGGEIDVESEPGRGSRFTVHLPKRSEDGR
jgi:signal transduction histidine kinase